MSRLRLCTHLIAAGLALVTSITSAHAASASPPARTRRSPSADKDKPWVAKLVKAYQSPEVRTYVSEKFAGSMVSAF